MAVQKFPAEKTLVVTGAGSPRGIGRATATRFASEGWAVAALDLDGAAAEGLAAELRERYGVAAVGVQADVSDEASVDRAVTEVESELPPIVALVNSAGISDPTPFFEMDSARWRRVIDINATGTFLVTHRVARGMVERGLGRIASISSTAAQNGGGNYSKSAYAASKAAIEGMSRAIALEFAPHGVTVNTIAPATINTDIMGGPLTEDRLPDFLSRVPVGRVGEVSEVAGLLFYLCGEEAGYITGATYNINGGHRIG
jgi:NAD(P)-dependent dehydrogenase (short-subunit alcohol dehydrogenase family)